MGLINLSATELEIIYALRSRNLNSIKRVFLSMSLHFNVNQIKSKAVSIKEKYSDFTNIIVIDKMMMRVYRTIRLVVHQAENPLYLGLRYG